MSTEDYLAELNLLDAEEIAEKVELLNIAPILKKRAFLRKICTSTQKIGFGFNYVDKSLDITHDNDAMGEHGSHVEGISAANAYIPRQTARSSMPMKRSRCRVWLPMHRSSP